MTTALAVAAVLAAAAVVLLALPFLRPPQRPAPADQDERTRRALELAEERDRALAALKELEFDHRTGKIEEGDYRALVGPLRAQAADALRALESFRADRGTTSATGGPPAERKEHEMVSVPGGIDPVPGGDPPQPARVPEPFPPPDEGQPPQPAIVPEPFPPPDEGDRPTQPDVPEPTPGGAAR